MDQPYHYQEPGPTNNVLLIGLMGSGKSTVGALLADRLGYTFIDLDKEITTSMECSIQEIFERFGEERFRDEEHRLLREHCYQGKKVIACGGGIVVRPENHACLHRQQTIYLEASPETLAQRVGSGEGRPLLKGAISVAHRLATILKEREPLYESSARITVTTENREPEDIMAEILTRLRPNLTSGAP